MLDNELQEQVKNAIDGSGADPVPAEVPKEVTSPEVKVEEPKVEAQAETPKEPVNVDKLQEQINNLNAALKEARAEAKGKVDQTKVAELEKKLEERESIIAKLEGVFTPAKEQEREVEPKYLTLEEAEALWQQKQEEQKQSSFKEKQEEMIKTEIATLEKEWDGKDGKPLYSDEEVLKWQQANSKLYLSPSEAFAQMKRNEIIDWEVNQRLSNKKKVENVEQPGVSPDIHTPAENVPKTEQELRDAISAAINAVNAEM
jgi:hypothetical protein